MTVSGDEVRAAFLASGVPKTWWVTAIEADRLIVADQATGRVYRVPFTAKAGRVTFGAAVQVALTYADVTAAAAWPPPQSRGGPMRTIDEAIDNAVRRGAITEARAGHWAALAMSRPDAIEWLDQLAGSPVLAAAAPQARAWATDPDVYGAVSQSADPLYAANPLYVEMGQQRPELLAQALAENPSPPRLFGDRDRPLFTASGLDPALLGQIPWPLRRAVAEAKDLAGAYNLIAKYEEHPEMAVVDWARHPLNEPYLSAFSRWLAGQGQHPADRRASGGVAASAADSYSVDQLHAELFGPRATVYSREPGTA